MQEHRRHKNVDRGPDRSFNKNNTALGQVRKREKSTCTIAELQEMRNERYKHIEASHQKCMWNEETGIVAPDISADYFEARPELINDVQKRKFYGRPCDDPAKHMNSFDRICALHNGNELPIDTIRMFMFPFSLAGQGAEWHLHVPSESVSTWSDVKKEFFGAFIPRGEIAKIRRELLSFQQPLHETLGRAWWRLNRYVRKHPYHGFSKEFVHRIFYQGCREGDRKHMDLACDGEFLDLDAEEGEQIMTILVGELPNSDSEEDVPDNLQDKLDKIFIDYDMCYPSSEDEDIENSREDYSEEDEEYSDEQKRELLALSRLIESGELTPERLRPRAEENDGRRRSEPERVGTAETSPFVEEDSVNQNLESENSSNEMMDNTNHSNIIPTDDVEVPNLQTHSLGHSLGIANRRSFKRRASSQPVKRVAERRAGRTRHQSDDIYVSPGLAEWRKYFPNRKPARKWNPYRLLTREFCQFTGNSATNQILDHFQHSSSEDICSDEMTEEPEAVGSHEENPLERNIWTIEELGERTDYIDPLIPGISRIQRRDMEGMRRIYQYLAIMGDSSECKYLMGHDADFKERYVRMLLYVEWYEKQEDTIDINFFSPEMDVVVSSPAVLRKRSRSTAIYCAPCLLNEVPFVRSTLNIKSRWNIMSLTAFRDLDNVELKKFRDSPPSSKWKRKKPVGMAKKVRVAFQGQEACIDFLVLDTGPEGKKKIAFGIPFINAIQGEVDEERGEIKFKTYERQWTELLHDPMFDLEEEPKSRTVINFFKDLVIRGSLQEQSVRYPRQVLTEEEIDELLISKIEFRSYHNRSLILTGNNVIAEVPQPTEQPPKVVTTAAIPAGDEIEPGDTGNQTREDPQLS